MIYNHPFKTKRPDIEVTEVIRKGKISYLLTPKKNAGQRFENHLSLNKVALCFLCLALFSIPVYSYTNSQIADAIKKVENSKRYPYGIVSINTKGDEAYARKICINTIRNQRKRHAKHNCGKDFLTCLRDRYAPLNADNDPKGLNKNWLKNLKFFLEKGGGE